MHNPSVLFNCSRRDQWQAAEKPGDPRKLIRLSAVAPRYNWALETVHVVRCNVRRYDSLISSSPRPARPTANEVEDPIHQTRESVLSTEKRQSIFSRPQLVPTI